LVKKKFAHTQVYIINNDFFYTRIVLNYKLLQVYIWSYYTVTNGSAP